MNKKFLYIPALLVLGILIIYISDDAWNVYGPVEVPGMDDSQNDTTGDVLDDTGLLQASFDNDTNVTSDTNKAATIQALMDKVEELEDRILELEQAPGSQSASSLATPANVQTTAASQMNRMLTVGSLVKAGIDESIAADIVRRRNDIELRKLKLRDVATREGYFGTARYITELAALTAEETSLREDLGDDSYDHYLHANRRPNRVKVSSVMMGSAAEQAGMKDGDIILTYGQQRIFEWSELKQSTSQGELGEYVNVDIMRDGQLMSLWMPRGPLGVRLGFARVKPE